MTAHLSIEGNLWCFRQEESPSLSTYGHGSTIRDAQTNFNRKAGSTVRRPSLLGNEIQSRYGLSDWEYDEMLPAQFVDKFERFRKIMEGSHVRKG